MKIKNLLLLSFTVILLVQCKKKSGAPYPDDYILMDNAKAVVYFHTVFREAENAWAFIHDKNYISGAYSDPSSISTMYKKLTYDEETNTVTIEYNAWVSESSPDLLLVGNMYVTFEKHTYRTVSGSVANVKLNGFSINGQIVGGESKITYQKVANSENDNYNYILLDGAAIHEKENPMQVLISGAIRDGRYVHVRTKEKEDDENDENGEDGEEDDGGETTTQEDDIWTYSGSMSGKLGEDQSLTYTNTILTTYTYTDENGETQDGTVRFTAKCNFPEKGVAQIKIPGRTDITYIYHCKGVDYVTVTHVE